MLMGDFLWKIFQLLAVTKVVEGSFSSDIRGGENKSGLAFEAATRVLQ